MSLALAVVLALAAAAPASADPFDDYKRDGSINPCSYSDQELDDALKGLPPDALQYSPGLADQLGAGREGCGGSSSGSSDPRQYEAVPGAAGGGGGAPGGGGAAGTTAGAPAAIEARVPDPPAPEAAAKRRLANIATPAVSATPGSDVPGWVVVLLMVLALGAVLAALIRWGGLSTDRLTRPLRAAFSEAGGRSADAAAELWDVVRLRR